MMQPFDVRFVQLLKRAIADDLTRLHTELGNGSQIAADAATTGMKCVSYMGQIRAMERALGIIDDVNKDMTKGKPKDTRQDD